MNIKEKVTSNILNKLEEWVLPWQQTRNTIQYSWWSWKAYSWINQLNLMIRAWEKKFTSPLRVTFNNAKDLWGSIKKYEKWTPCIYFKMLKKLDNNGKEETIPMMKIYWLFNVDQTTVAPEKVYWHDLIDTRLAEDIFENFTEKPRHIRAPQPHYRPKQDIIWMPNKDQFNTEASFYWTEFHELWHSLIHPTRMDLPVFNKKQVFWSRDYMLEELPAEFCSAFLTASCWIDNESIQNNNVAYFASWLKNEKNKAQLIINGAKEWRKRSEYILSKSILENGLDTDKQIIIK